MKPILRIFILFSILLSGNTAFGQDKNIHGTVTTFKSIPLKNAEITTSKTQHSTLTDSLGKFTIECSDKDRLQVDAEGFDHVNVKMNKVEDPDHLKIDLIYSNNAHSFDDATKNGHISPQALKTAMSKYPLKGEKDYTQYNNVFELIDNEIFNVDVNGEKVLTQKKNSFTSSQEVLYVVDGVTVSNVSFLVPANIRSVKYIDGTQAAIYGSRGANGVIVVETKKAR